MVLQWYPTLTQGTLSEETRSSLNLLKPVPAPERPYSNPIPLGANVYSYKFILEGKVLEITIVYIRIIIFIYEM